MEYIYLVRVAAQLVLLVVSMYCLIETRNDGNVTATITWAALFLAAWFGK